MLSVKTENYEGRIFRFSQNAFSDLMSNYKANVELKSKETPPDLVFALDYSDVAKCILEDFGDKLPVGSELFIDDNFFIRCYKNFTVFPEDIGEKDVDHIFRPAFDYDSSYPDMLVPND